jgi:hypothetical protein
MLRRLDVAQDRQCLIDSLPIPVVPFHLVPSSTGDWRAYGARFGKVPSKNQTIFGYRLHLLTTLGGVILDFELAPANESDLEVGFELLMEPTDLDVLGDKGYISAEKADELWQANRLCLRTLPRRNQKEQVSRDVQHLFNAVRQRIETVNGQLTEQFHVEINHAHTFCGLCARLNTKLTAHVLCIYINRLRGKAEFLQNKALSLLCTLHHESDEPMSQQHGKGYEMQSDQHLRQALIVARQTAEARHPAKAALDNPATRQQHKAALDRRQLHDFQADSMFLSGSSWIVAGVPWSTNVTSTELPVAS